MVKTIAFLLAAMTGVASAGGEVDRVAKLGFRIGYGPVPIEKHEARTTTIAIGIEHPTFGKTRMFGEWEWMWINGWRDENLHGSGQRMTAGLRRAFGVLSTSSTVRMFIDGELGGGAMLATEDRMGESAVPVGLAGLRLGYDFRNGESSSRVFEAEVLVRTIVVPTGYGIMFGVGMLWGD